MSDLYQKPELRFVEVSKQEDGETSIEVMVGDAQVGSVEMTPPGGEDGDWFVIAVYYDHAGQACEQEGFANHFANHEEAMSVIEKWYAEWWDATWRALCGEPSKVMHPKPSLAVAGGVTMSHWTDPLRGGACADEIKDGRQYDTFAGWWGGTQHADDMLSLLAAIEYRDDRTLRLLSCRFVRETRVGDTRRTVWDLLTDERSRKAVVIAELYAEGDATSEELGSAEGDAVRAAASAARATARAAEWEAASAAAWVARATARAAEWEAASAAARAARAVAWATATSASVAATKSALAQQADIIRDMIPVEEIAPLFERYIERLQGGDR